jgi:CO/xanthine dehydrogenase Mo-binding subunit
LTSYKWVGKPVQRVDGKDKVCGTMKFPTDVSAPDVLHCKAVFAPSAHARLLEIHSEEALKTAGVVAVFTHKNVPGPNLFGFRNDRPVLCDEKTRYAGDMVAVVAAETEEAALLGVEKVRIDWEPLPLVTDPEQAILEDAPRVHKDGNILHESHYVKGDVDAVFERTDVIISEHTYYPQMMDHAFLETEAGIAFPEDGGVRVIAGAQVPYADQMWLSKCLDLPPEKSRLIEPYSGGAFGGRGDISVQLVIALAALKTGRPCRMAWSRSEHFLAGPKRHPCKIWVRTAASKDGELLAHQARIIADTGGYAIFGDNILETIIENITGLYRIPNVKVDAWSALTNNPICGAFRGFGAPQACLALEGQMSDLARQLDQDEIAFRLKNVLTQGETAGMGHKLMLPIGIQEALKAAAQHPLWKNRKDYAVANGPIHRGVGMAVASKGYGLGINDAPDFSAVDIILKPEGRFLLTTGVVEIGQGSYTVLMQMAAEVLNCGPEFFDVTGADTVYHPDSGTSAASRITYAVGLSSMDAARQMDESIRTLASQKWEVSLDEVGLEDGIVRNLQSDATLSLADIAKLAGSEELRAESRLRVPYSEIPSEGGLNNPHILYSSNVQIALAAVDIETGETSVEKVVTFPEAGRVINPLGLEGQCDGGVAQGLAYALMEETFLKDGRVVNDNFSVYSIPTSKDMPEVEIIPVEVLEASGPYGAKGAAENATIPTAPAILDAIADAIDVRFTAMPVTPEKVISTLADKTTLLDIK